MLEEEDGAFEPPKAGLVVEAWLAYHFASDDPGLIMNTYRNLDFRNSCFALP